MIADGEVLVAARARRSTISSSVALPSDQVVWRVEVAAQVAELDERRQLAAARRLELARVLAQLRRDERVAEMLVQLLLVARREDLAASRPSWTPYSETESPRLTAASRSATLWSFEPVKCWSRLPYASGGTTRRSKRRPSCETHGRLRVAAAPRPPRPTSGA